MISFIECKMISEYLVLHSKNYMYFMFTRKLEKKEIYRFSR